MSRLSKNKIHIHWMEDNKEKHKVIFCKDFPEMKWENGTELFIRGLTEVCRFFHCLTPDDIDFPYRWCFEYIPTSSIDPDLSWQEKKDKIYNTDEYKDWYRMKRESRARECTDSMFSDAYLYLIEACRNHNNGEDVDGTDLEDKEWKEPFWVNYLFDEYVGNQESRADTGAWIFRDGSYITVEAGNHRRIVEEYINLKEFNVERYWVKVQLYCAYTHNRMTDAQKKTLNKFFKKYEELYEMEIQV